MDKLDKISVFAIAVLAVSAFFLVAVYANDAGDRDQFVVRQQARMFNPELDKKVRIAKGLLENNNLLKAEELAAGLTAAGQKSIRLASELLHAKTSTRPG